MRSFFITLLISIFFAYSLGHKNDQYTVSSMDHVKEVKTAPKYKAVVIVHGILDHKNSMNSLVRRIRKKHPGTNVTVINALHGWKSLSPLWYQVNKFKADLDPVMQANPDGIHLIGFSQGGLVARALVQSIPNHNIRHFISLSSPQAGQFGDSFLRIYFPGYVKETVWRIFYTRTGQWVSVANYWRDPFHLDAYMSADNFLPVLNNACNPPPPPLPEVKGDPPFAPTFLKDNFLKLKKLVLIGGPDDGVISPWQSALFDYYVEGNDTIVEPMTSRSLYIKDSFGLRTLDKTGRLFRFVVPGVTHLQWHRNSSIVDQYILPHLT